MVKSLSISNFDMKRFIIRFFIFLLFPLAFFLINLQVNRYLIATTIPNIKPNNILVVGDSHTATAINPAQLTGSINFSQNAEPYIITYYKLEHLIKGNDIQTVILGFSYHNLSAFNDLKLSKKPWAPSQFEHYYPFISLNKLRGLSVDRQLYLQTVVQNLLLYPKKNHNAGYRGGYNQRAYALDRANFKTAIDRHYFYEGEQIGTSTVSAKYLEQAVLLSEREGFKLVLVNTPLHPEYLERIPVDNRSFYKMIKKRYEGRVTILDYSDYPLDDKLFYDYDHLNSDGALIFSAMLNEDLMHLP